MNNNDRLYRCGSVMCARHREICAGDKAKLGTDGIPFCPDTNCKEIAEATGPEGIRPIEERIINKQLLEEQKIVLKMREHRINKTKKIKGSNVTREDLDLL